MNRFRLGAAMLILLPLLGLLAQHRMMQIHEPLSRAMAEASEQAIADHPEEAIRIAAEVQSLWQKHRDLTAALADHQPLEDIDALLSQLPPASKDPAAYAALCAELSQRLQAIADAHRVKWMDLF